MLYHIATATAWAEAQKMGTYTTGEEFIHLSYAHQWRLTQQRYYRGQSDLVLLHVGPVQPVKVENGFPHLYGPLPCAAVQNVTPLATLRDLHVALYSAQEPDSLPEADLVVLPEMPFNRWFAESQDVDAADQDGDRSQRQADLARTSGRALLGGVLQGRANLACLWDAQGREVLRYQKMHLPQEPGFWEASHTDPGTDPPRVCDALGFPLGVQICSDIHRPFGGMYLMAQGCSLILAPRATQSATFAKWRIVYQAMARMTACYVLSVNRPGWGPSLAVAPDGQVLAESDEPVLTVEVRHEEIVRARADYPGYLGVPAQVYANAWAAL